MIGVCLIIAGWLISECVRNVFWQTSFVSIIFERCRLDLFSLIFGVVGNSILELQVAGYFVRVASWSLMTLLFAREVWPLRGIRIGEA